jgi:hypothetical protein
MLKVGLGLLQVPPVPVLPELVQLQERPPVLMLMLMLTMGPVFARQPARLMTWPLWPSFAECDSALYTSALFLQEERFLGYDEL